MKLLLAAAFLCSCFAAAPASSQSKVEAALTREAQSKKVVRVLVVTRPDPHATNGGTPFASAQSYLSGILGGSAKNVTAIGSLPVVSAEVDASALEKLNNDPNVALVTRDTPQPLALMDSVPFIGGSAAHSDGYDGHGYAVAVLDTGVQYDHPALAGSISAEACFSTPSSNQYKLKSLCPGGHDVSLVAGAARGCPSAIPGCEHGTHVAGIIAGHNMKFEGKTFEGVAPKATLVVVQVFTQFLDQDECGGSAPCILSFTSDQLRALEWLYKQIDRFNIAAINMSLGSGYFDAPCDRTSALTEIIERLKSKGVATVVAAGNSHYFDAVAEPACISSTISVAAENKAGDIDVEYSNRSNLVHFVAPGTRIVSSVPGGGYTALSGTSMAAPHVAAAFAAFRSKYPSLTVREIENKLVGAGHPIEDPTTGAKFTSLSLREGSMQRPATVPAATAAPEKPSGLSNSAAADGSYIVRTDKSQGDVKSSISEACQDKICEVKQINRNEYKVDIVPKSGSTTGLPIPAPNAQELERILGGPNSNVRAFENRKASPF
ncbi:alkaline protease [Alsobacter metallidurans]|uniref:Alkaline protease n=2 Tax=Alsobacter metallidurans TaxID=340221 RepID=A0A917MIZ9_9HYPH|nr:alkaline protease [Alsobacter metallidurans]